MKKITLFIMDVGVLDQRFSLSECWQGKSLVSRVPLGTRHYHHSIAPNELDGNSIRRTHTQGLVYKRYNHRFKSTVIIISTKYSQNLTYIQILRYRKKYQLKALKTYKGHQPFYICCYNDYQKTIKPFFAKKYVNLGM